MGSIPVGSTKKQTRLCLLLLSLRRIVRLLTQPDSRTLGRLADAREYQNDCEDSRFFTPRLEIEGRRSVVPIPERSACSLIHGSTKKQTQTCLLLLSLISLTHCTRIPFQRKVLRTMNRMAIGISCQAHVVIS